jgi:hypothetical protein
VQPSLELLNRQHKHRHRSGACWHRLFCRLFGCGEKWLTKTTRLT